MLDQNSFCKINLKYYLDKICYETTFRMKTTKYFREKLANSDLWYYLLVGLTSGAMRAALPPRSMSGVLNGKLRP